MRKCRSKLFCIVIAAAVFGVGMIPTNAVKARSMKTQRIGQNEIADAARKTEPKEWNKKEVKAYKFADLYEALKYTMIGGTNYYSKTYFSSPYKIKVQAVESGTLYILASTSNRKLSDLYDYNMKHLQKIGVGGFIRVNAKAGDCYYVQFPSNAKEGAILTYVVEDQFQSLKKGRLSSQRGTGNWTNHTFKIKKRSLAEFYLDLMDPDGERALGYLQKKEKGVWKKIGKQVRISKNFQSTTYGLAPGTYRLRLKANPNQGVDVLYHQTAVRKKVAYRRKKAQKLESEKKFFEFYTTKEKSPRWYRISVTSAKKQRKLKLHTEANQGGFRFTIYQAGRKKPYKIKKVSGDRSVTVKLPRERRNYEIRVSKISKKTTGLYQIQWK